MYAVAVTAVVKQPFRTIVSVVGTFLCQHSSVFLVREWLTGTGDVDEVCAFWDITQRREAFPYRRFGTT